MCPSAQEAVALRRTARSWLSSSAPRKAPRPLRKVRAAPALRKAAPSSRTLGARQRKVAGTHDGAMYECSRYVWRNKREHCSLEADRRFRSRRMAILYVAKMNSDSLQTYLAESGKRWHDLCSDTGRYALSPNAPFDMEQFLEMADDAIEKYGAEVGNVLTVRKAPQGTIFRFKVTPLATTEVEELCQILAS